jgi:hypothetical protein
MTLLSTVAAADGKPTRQALTRSAAQLAIREADDSGSAHLRGLSAVSVQLRIGPKLLLALAGLLAATVMVSGVAVAGLSAVNAQTQKLYHHNILTTQAITELQATLDDAAASARQLLPPTPTRPGWSGSRRAGVPSSG